MLNIDNLLRQLKEDRRAGERRYKLCPPTTEFDRGQQVGFHKAIDDCERFLRRHRDQGEREISEQCYFEFLKADIVKGNQALVALYEKEGKRLDLKREQVERDTERMKAKLTRLSSATTN